MMFKKDEKALKQYVRETPPDDIAYGMVTAARTRTGTYRFLPLLGNIAARQEKRYLVFQGILMKTYRDEQVGTMSWTIPLNERTLPSGAALLAAFGWEGRIWPLDPGWPDNDPHEVQGLGKLLRECHLDASFVFPPDPGKGSRCLKVQVTRLGAIPFPLPPVLEPEDAVEVTSLHLSKLIEAMNHPEIFMASAPTDPTRLSRIRTL